MPPKTRRRAAKSPQRNDSKHKISRSSRQGLRSTMRSDPKLEDEPSIQTAASSATPRIGFLSVPIEIRDMIYRLLLTKDDPVCIRSSSMRNPHIARPVNHTTSIVRVNRQISDEALPILYSSQPFEFSDGTRSRVTDADILKSFLATLRPHLIASITSMNLTACLRMGYAANMLGHYYLMSGDLNYASNFREMCQQMLKNMKGLRSVTIDFGPWGNSIHALRLLSRTATVSGLAGSVRMLMKLPKLKQMKLIDNNIDGFSLLLEKIVSDKPLTDKLSSVMVSRKRTLVLFCYSCMSATLFMALDPRSFAIPYPTSNDGTHSSSPPGLPPRPPPPPSPQCFSLWPVRRSSPPTFYLQHLGNSSPSSHLRSRSSPTSATPKALSSPSPVPLSVAPVLKPCSHRMLQC